MEFTFTEALIDYITRIPKIAMDLVVGVMFIRQISFFYETKLK